MKNILIYYFRKDRKNSQEMNQEEKEFAIPKITTMKEKNINLKEYSDFLPVFPEKFSYK